MTGSWPNPRKASTPETVKAARAWDWVTTLPVGASRAEVVVPAVWEQAVVQVLPQWPHDEIKTVSTGSELRECRITGVNEIPVSDYNQLHAAVARAVGSGKNISVTLSSPGQVGKGGKRMAVEPAQLLALSQAAAPKEKLLRVTEDGNTWVILREGAVRCKLMTRLERSRCLLHVAVGLEVCWGPQLSLPREVCASCDGTPLQCLSVAETLEVLYGSGSEKKRDAEPNAHSFAVVSEQADYRMPTNYKRLQKAQEEAASKSQPVPTQPALVTVPGLSYPGPAALGDARALSAFVQQRELYQAGEPERVGWLMFSGPALRQAQTIKLDIDLGQGPNHLTFMLPKL
jgi:hypothetical protein